MDPDVHTPNAAGGSLQPMRRPATTRGPAPEAQATVVPLSPRPTAEREPGQGPVRDDAGDERRAELARLEAALHERYIVRRAAAVIDLGRGTTEYRYRGDTTRVAFTESRFRLATDHNSPSVARSMVDLAEARRWSALRVSGHDDFKRLVWLEASARGLKTLGYEPVPGDLEQLQRLQAARQVNRIEPERGRVGHAVGHGGTTGSAAAKAAGRGSGGRKAVIAALEAVLVARRVPAPQREAVLAMAEEQLARRRAAGQTHQVKVYDKAAPSQRPPPAPVREQAARVRERAAPAR